MFGRRCDMKQAIEWFIAAMKAVPAHTISNCWAVCKICSIEQQLELDTGMRHNNRSGSTVAQSQAGVSPKDIEDLSQLLTQLSTGLSIDESSPLEMVDAVELIDLGIERESLYPPSYGEDEHEDDEDLDEELMPILDGEHLAIPVVEEGDVNEKEPTPLLTLAQAKEYSERLFDFVIANEEHMRPISDTDFIGLADHLRHSISRMNTTCSIRQVQITQFMLPSSSL